MARYGRDFNRWSQEYDRDFGSAYMGRGNRGGRDFDDEWSGERDLGAYGGRWRGREMNRDSNENRDFDTRRGFGGERGFQGGRDFDRGFQTDRDFDSGFQSARGSGGSFRGGYGAGYDGYNGPQGGMYGHGRGMSEHDWRSGSRGMSRNYDRDFGDRMREGWNRFRRSARRAFSDGYDRGW